MFIPAKPLFALAAACVLVAGCAPAPAGVEGGGSGIMRAAGDIGTVKEIAEMGRPEADAKAHEEATRQADEMMRSMQDLIREVREKLQAIEQSRVETNRGVARNI